MGKKIADYPDRYKIAIKFVGETREEARAWAIKHYGCVDNCEIRPGRSLREGRNVIENSDVEMQDLIGEWHDGRKPVLDYRHVGFILLPTGKALGIALDGFYESSLIYTEMDWYVEDNIFTFDTGDEFSFFRGPLVYKEHKGENMNFYSSLERANTDKNSPGWFPQYLYKHNSQIPYPVQVEKCLNDYEFYKKWGVDAYDTEAGRGFEKRK